jgi:hypothetical protein
MLHFNKSLLLALALLAVSAMIGAAQYVSRPVDIAVIPAAPTVADPVSIVQPAYTPLNAAVGGTASHVETLFGTATLSENSYDFGNLDGVPGFGTLPPAYDSTPVMPKIGSR